MNSFIRRWFARPPCGPDQDFIKYFFWLLRIYAPIIGFLIVVPIALVLASMLWAA